MKPIVSVKWLSKNFNNPNLVILDASPKQNKSNLKPDFPGILIKGAQYFDMECVFLDKGSDIPNMIPSAEVFTTECQKLGINKNSIIIVYDNLGIYTSPRVWWMFKAMGHSNIAVLDGGLSAWKKENLPISQVYKVTIEQGNFSANYQPKLVRDSNSILENITTKKALIVDARSKGRFSGNIPEPRKNMESGHIPNSLNIPFQQVLNNGYMKSARELNTIFDELDIHNKPLIFTCGSGITACIILLAAELVLNNEKALFDGSWSEWGQLNKFPVEKKT